MDSNKIKKSLNKFRLPLIILLIVVVIVSALSFSVASDARKLGRGLGRKYGTVVGNMKGSYEGYKNGTDDGTNDGRTPEPPTIEIVERIREQGRLHVMEASLTISDKMMLGDENDPKFAILFSQDAKADYYVDLSSITVQEDGKELIIIVPDVVCELIIDNDSYSEIERYEGKNDASDKAHNMQIESKREIYNKINSEFNEEGTLKSQARDTARKQVADLSKTLSGKTVTVKFLTKDGEYR